MHINCHPFQRSLFVEVARLLCTVPNYLQLQISYPHTHLRSIYIPTYSTSVVRVCTYTHAYRHTTLQEEKEKVSKDLSEGFLKIF